MLGPTGDQVSRGGALDLKAYWLPFTANRAFKKAPRFIFSAKRMHYFTSDGRAVIDGTSGLWCTQCRS